MTQFTLEDFQEHLRLAFPGSNALLHEGEEIIIHTGLRLQSIDGELKIVPLKSREVPDNIIVFDEHPKFRAAHPEWILDEMLTNILEDEDFD